MSKLKIEYFKPEALIGLIMIFSISISFGLEYLLERGVWISVSTTAIISSLIFFIERNLWKYPPFKYMFIINDMSGRYEGRIEFFHPIERIVKEKKCAVEVSQTGCSISVNSYFEKEDGRERTLSESITEKIIKNKDNTFSIVYTYMNGGMNKDVNFSPHYGTNILKFIKNKDGQFLKGDYYTDRNPQTKGRIEVKFISKQLNNDY